MMRAAFSSLGREERIEFIPMPEVLRGKYQYFTEARMEKLRAAGYRKPVQSLEEGVAAYIPYLEMGEQILGWN
jgi:ADP-L-glycero-D-manno-heptose 6-epimerase